MRRALLIALLLAGCTSVGPEEPPMPQISYRDSSVAISSSTRFDPQRFAGTWTRLASFNPEYDGAACKEIRFTPMPDGRMAVAGCQPSQGRAAGTVLYTLAPFSRLEAEGAEPIWILWVAEDFGTAVLGTPSGSFGWILNRGDGIRPDRFRAARELLDFNGYDTARLRRH